MEMIKAIKEEIALRDKGRIGKLGNLTTLQLIVLAYKLGIQLRG